MKGKNMAMLAVAWLLAMAAHAAEPIRISTQKMDLIMQVNGQGRLVQSYLGKRLLHDSDLGWLKEGREVYLTHGMEDYFEPAVDIEHADGNPSTLLRYVSHEVKPVQGGKETVITLADDQYPTTVRLHYVAYDAENVIKTWTEITNGEKKSVKLAKYASAMLHLDREAYYLTAFSGDWADEAHMNTEPLKPGKRVIDTKLGTRANMFTPPMFLSLIHI